MVSKALLNAGEALNGFQILEFFRSRGSIKYVPSQSHQTKHMTQGCYKLGYCKNCRRNAQHFRGRKSWRARVIDLSSLYVLNYGPWFCSQCEDRKRSLPWIRKSEPTIQHVEDGTERIGNFIRSDGSLVLRKKRSSRYSSKFREGVILRLLGGKTTIAQLTTELKVTEADLLAWISEVIENRDNRIEELTSLLRSYHKAAASLIGISDETLRYDSEENMIDAHFERNSAETPLRE